MQLSAVEQMYMHEVLVQGSAENSGWRYSCKMRTAGEEDRKVQSNKGYKWSRNGHVSRVWLGERVVES